MGGAEADPVLTDLSEGVLTLTLNRPARLNAFNEAMHLALRAGLQRAHDDPAVRAVLLTGAGRGFSAGQDLGDRDPRRGGPPPDLGRTLDTYYNPTLRLIRSLEKPVICAVNGVAAGAGANLALSCDIVLAARSARFIQSFARVGLIPDAGGSWLLTRLLGEARAKALALTAEPLGAEQAADWGLIWRAVERDQLSFSNHCVAEHRRPCKHATFGRLRNVEDSAEVLQLDYGYQLECRFCKKFEVNAAHNPQRSSAQMKEDGARRRAFELLLAELYGGTPQLRYRHEKGTELADDVWKRFGCACFNCGAKL